MHNQQELMSHWMWTLRETEKSRMHPEEEGDGAGRNEELNLEFFS